MKVKRLPRRRKEHFPRLAGLWDRLFHKVDICPDSSGPVLRSGRVVRLQRRFDRYQHQVEEWLLSQLHPLHREASHLLAACEHTALLPQPSPADTSGGIRRAKAASDRRAAQVYQLSQDRKELVKLVSQIRHLCQLADIRIDQAKGAYEIELALYAKATRFAVVDREIPVLTRSFYANQALDPAFMEKISHHAGLSNCQEVSK